MMTRNIYIFAIICILFSGCKTAHDLSYFDSITEYDAGIIPGSDHEIKILPEDELLITVTSEVPSATAQFNQPMFNPILRSNLQDLAGSTQSISSSTSNISGSSRIPTYIVDKNGDIDFPSLGEIHVAGMTTQQIAKFIKEKASATVKDPIVKVALVNFKVNVLGEVAEPQTINVTKEKFSIFDAISTCGDLSEYGKRDNLIVIRENEDGTHTYQRLNLHDTTIFSSPYYYLKQNDIVYVEPNNIKQDNSKYNQNNSFKLSTISTIVSAASVIASLVIALTVK